MMFAFQVLFRYAIAIFKYMENILLQQTDYMTIYRTLRDGLETLVDTRKLTQVRLQTSFKDKKSKAFNRSYQISYIQDIEKENQNKATS